MYSDPSPPYLITEHNGGYFPVRVTEGGGGEVGEKEGLEVGRDRQRQALQPLPLLSNPLSLLQIHGTCLGMETLCVVLSETPPHLPTDPRHVPGHGDTVCGAEQDPPTPPHRSTARAWAWRPCAWC